MLDPGPPPGLEGYSAIERLSLEVSAAQMRQAQADTPLGPMPLRPVPLPDAPEPVRVSARLAGRGAGAGLAGSQDKLAKLVPGARHVIAAKSGHYIQLDQPRLVTREIRRVVSTARSR